MPNDPWKHRSTGMKCQTCMWWVAKEVEIGQIRSENGALGRCRKHAPTMGGFPATFQMDWCGDHKLDENKLVETEEPVPIDIGVGASL